MWSDVTHARTNRTHAHLYCSARSVAASDSLRSAHISPGNVALRCTLLFPHTSMPASDDNWQRGYKRGSTQDEYELAGGQEVPLWESEADHFRDIRTRHRASFEGTLAGMGRRDSEDVEEAGDENARGTSRWEAAQLVGAPRRKEAVAAIDARAGRYPCCIVWTALPGWVHMGCRPLLLLPLLSLCGVWGALGV